jgi:DNA polymerase III gamma/tau subunit
LRSLLALKLGLARDVLGLSPGDLKKLEQQAAGFTVQQLSQTLETVVGYEESIKFTLMPRIQLEVMALKLAGLAGGVAAPPVPPPTADRQPPNESSCQVTQRAGGQAGGSNPPLDHSTARPPDHSSSVKTSQVLWDQVLAELHETKPLLAGILAGVRIVSSTGDSICISAPETPMWDEKELAAELKAAEAGLSRIAARPMRVVIAQDAQSGAGGGKKKRSTLDKFRAVYDCEEL